MADESFNERVHRIQHDHNITLKEAIRVAKSEINVINFKERKMNDSNLTTGDSIDTELLELGAATIEVVKTTGKNLDDVIAWIKGFKTVNEFESVQTKLKVTPKEGEILNTSQKTQTISFQIGDYLALDDEGNVFVIKPALFELIKGAGEEDSEEDFIDPAKTAGPALGAGASEL